MYRDRSVYILRILCLTLLFHSGVSWGSDAKHRNECETWLKEHYRSYSHIETIREYTQASEYHYRANYNVVPYEVSPATIGFDCTVYLEIGKVVALPTLDPYTRESKPKSAVTSLPERRLKWGSDACPDIVVWKQFSDELRKGNYSVKLSSSCIWLEKGDRVFGPLERTEYNRSPFVLISLPSGKRYWIEGGSL